MVRHTTAWWKSYISICFRCRLYMLWLNFNITNKFWVQLWYRCYCAYLRTDHGTSTVKHNGNLSICTPGGPHPDLSRGLRARTQGPSCKLKLCFSNSNQWTCKNHIKITEKSQKCEIKCFGTLGTKPTTFLHALIPLQFFSRLKISKKVFNCISCSRAVQ